MRDLLCKGGLVEPNQALVLRKLAHNAAHLGFDVLWKAEPIALLSNSDRALLAGHHEYLGRAGSAQAQVALSKPRCQRTSLRCRAAPAPQPATPYAVAPYAVAPYAGATHAGARHAGAGLLF